LIHGFILYNFTAYKKPNMLMRTILRPLSLLILCPAFFFTACTKENITNVTNSYLNPPTADAGAAQNISATAASLSGSGTSDNGPITGYLWSLISGPNLPEILTPSAASTAVTGMIQGTYVFQFAVIDSMGLTGIDSTSVTVTSLPIHTLILQPANNNNELNFAEHDGANASAHQQDIDAGSWTWSGLSLTIRGSFMFDLSSIPAGSTVLSASLSLYSNPTPINGDLVNANSGTDNSMHIRRITDSWDASTATWQMQPGTTIADQVIIPHTDLPFFDLIDINVKNMVSAMVVSGNNGFMMGLENESPYNVRQFASSVHADASKHPKLVITYQ
jgi:hypothetical protein